MPIVGLRELNRETSDVIDRLLRDGEPVLLTRHGKPVAALTAVTEEQAATIALAVVPEFVESRERAARAIAMGEGRPASEILAEVEAEDAADGIDDPEAAREPELAAEEVEIPDSLVDQLTTSALLDLSADERVTVNDDVQRAYRTYVNAVLASTMPSLRERLRAVSQNIAAHPATTTSETYAMELTKAAELEALAIPRHADA